NFNIILIQEPWLSIKGKTQAIRNFSSIYPEPHREGGPRVRAVTLVSTSIGSDHYVKLPIDSPDVVGIDIKYGPDDWMRIINVY
ncbi:hypothetical protein BDN71DRAFT_1363347, partial [Pleurotus eryngii]